MLPYVQLRCYVMHWCGTPLRHYLQGVGSVPRTPEGFTTGTRQRSVINRCISNRTGEFASVVKIAYNSTSWPEFYRFSTPSSTGITDY